MKIEHWTARQWHWLFLVGIVFVVTVHTVDWIIGRPSVSVTRAFHLGTESNISTWYASGILFTAGFYALMCYRTAALQHIKPRAGWLLASFFMIGLSCDEVACLHENVGRIVSTRLPALHQNFPHTIWPIVLGPVVLAVVIAMTWILYSHMKGALKAGVFMILGVTVFLGSAMGLEMITNILDQFAKQWLWEVQLIVEESGEMLGAWLIGLGVILRHERYGCVGRESGASERSKVQAVMTAIPG